MARPTELMKDAGKLAVTTALLSHIVTQQNANDAGVALRAIRERERKIKAHYLEVRRPLNRALDEIKAMERADLAPWEQADKALAAPLLAWQVEQEQAARVENARRLAAAEAVAKQERDDQAAAIRAAVASAPTKGVAKALERQAKDVEQAPLMLRTPEAAAAPKVEGVSVPKRRTAEVLEFAMLVRAVAEGRVSLDALQPNQKWLDAQAQALGTMMNVPGVAFREVPTLSARGL